MNELQIIATYSGFLSEIGMPHLVGGSLASSAWGEQRATNDADFLLQIDSQALDVFLNQLPRGFFAEETEVQQAVASHEDFASFQTLYEPTAFKLDNFIANGEWQREQMHRAKHLEIGGASIPFAGPEDTIVAKCRWFDLGNRVSDRQWHDLVRLMEVQRGNLDIRYIERWLDQFGLMDIWAELQRQS
jgi:hypothetical protein